MQKQSVMFLTMLLFGGTASLAGPICGVSIVMLMNELFRSAERYQMFIYGVMLLRCAPCLSRRHRLTEAIMFGKREKVSALVKDTPIPKMFWARQIFDTFSIPVKDIPDRVRNGLNHDNTGGKIKPGQRIAIAVGSRGICNQVLMQLPVQF